MKPMSREEAKALSEAWEANLRHQEAKLRDAGWTQKEYTWIDPVTGEEQDAERSYLRLMERKMIARGWRPFVEVKRLQGSKRPPTEWARYQSPLTNRVYTFLDALFIAENNWDESGYPELFCGHSVDLNNLLGPDFRGERVYTLFRAEGDKYVLEFWNNEA